MKIVYVVLLCLFNQMGAAAQDKPFFVTLHPLNLLERDGGITPGIGYHFNNRLAVSSDIGLIFFSAGEYKNDRIETSGMLGYKIKPTVRFYINERTIPGGGYLELEGMYKYVSYDAVNEVDILDNNGNIAYTYIGGYKIKKDVYGLNFKFGHRSFLDNDKRVGLDFYIGFGSRKKVFSNSGLPSGAQIDNSIFSENSFFNFYWREGKAFSLPAGFRIFYNF